jgi:hypothetical protein
MTSFDFGLQFLDTEKMTYWGKRRDAGFWIENASVKWREAQIVTQFQTEPLPKHKHPFRRSDGLPSCPSHSFLQTPARRHTLM